MRLLHYSGTEFTLEPREYNQDELNWNAKPHGFWVSVEGPYDWKSWCESEEFKTENLKFVYEVKLKKDARILRLKSASQVCKFSKLYPYIKPQWDNPEGRRICEYYEIDWKKVKSKYQGIIIAPYQWTCRINHDCGWYYGWDCASGCIWDLDCIKDFKLITCNIKEIVND